MSTRFKVDVASADAPLLIWQGPAKDAQAARREALMALHASVAIYAAAAGKAPPPLADARPVAHAQPDAPPHGSETWTVTEALGQFARSAKGMAEPLSITDEEASQALTTATAQAALDDPTVRGSFILFWAGPIVHPNPSWVRLAHMASPRPKPGQMVRRLHPGTAARDGLLIAAALRARGAGIASEATLWRAERATRDDAVDIIPQATRSGQCQALHPVAAAACLRAMQRATLANLPRDPTLDMLRGLAEPRGRDRAVIEMLFSGQGMEATCAPRL